MGKKLTAAGMIGGAWAVHQAFQSMEHAGMARAQEARAQEQHAHMLQSMQQYEQVATYMRNPHASEVLGAGRLAEWDDLLAANMFSNAGLYLGMFEGHPIYYNDDGHCLSYGRTRSGKGRDVILPVLGSMKSDSFIVTDIKDAENAYATAAARAARGHRVLALNPFGIAGIDSLRLNPCQAMIDTARAGYEFDGEDEQFINHFLPMTPKQAQAENSWALEGARNILKTRAKYLAYFRPSECCPATLWHMVNGSAEKIRAQYQEMIDCGEDSISEPAARFLYEFDTSEKQYAGYQTGLNRAVWLYAPNSVFAEETRVSDFDPADLKREPITVFAMLPADKIDVGAQWLTLAISTMMETIAATTGNRRTTVLLDEMANLPYMPIIPKALKLFAGKGVRLWGFCQGRHSLLDVGYSKETIREFEDQSGFLQLWEVEDTDLLKDVETWSGKKGVTTRSASMGGGGGLQGSFSTSEQARPVLQGEDIRAVGHGQQILKVAGCPYMIVADRKAWFEHRELNRILRDPREINSGVAENWKPARRKRTLMLPAPPPEIEEEFKPEDSEVIAMLVAENDDLREQLAELKEQEGWEMDIVDVLKKALAAVAKDKPA